MSRTRNNQKSDLFLSSSQTANERREVAGERSKTSMAKSSEQAVDEASTQENVAQDDCFARLGFSSSSEEKEQRMSSRTQRQPSAASSADEEHQEQDQPARLVEEIDAVTALIIYDTYSRKHQYTSSGHHRAKTVSRLKVIRDDVDRFDALYACLSEQASSESTNTLRANLRDRFFAQANVHELRSFQEKEYSRVMKEKQACFDRVPFIPNILSYQRTCPRYDLEEMKWIRQHLC